MLGLHIAVGILLIVLNAAAGLVGGIAWYRNRASIPFWYLLRLAQAAVFLQALLGGLLVVTNHEPEDGLHYLYGLPRCSSPSSPRAPASTPPSARSATSTRSPSPPTNRNPSPSRSSAVRWGSWPSAAA